MQNHIATSGRANVLFVEGSDDEHVIQHLIQFAGLKVEPSVKVKKSKSKLIKGISPQMKESGLKTIGLVVDANGDLQKTWKDIENVFSKSRLGKFPKSWPGDPKGFIGKGHKGVSVGVWIMPDNSSLGELEDFVQKMVPINDPMIPYARRYINGIKKLAQPPARFPDRREAKAIMRSWAAVQNEPGIQMGMAITQKLLNPKPTANNFLNWLANLYK